MLKPFSKKDETQNGHRNGTYNPEWSSSDFFSNKPFEKKLEMTIKDPDFLSDIYCESDLLGSGL